MSGTARMRTALITTLALLMLASSALAAGPSWMPTFPMRIGPSVMLMWAPVPGASAYNVYRSEKQGEQGAMVSSGPANNYMDNNVPMDKSFYYMVRAVTGGAEGDPSTQGIIAGVKPLDPPKWAGAMYNTATSALSIRWGIVAGAAFYNVYKGDGKEGDFKLVGSVQETTYADSGVEVGKSYYYKVSAVDKNNSQSPLSEVLEQKIEKQEVMAVAKEWAQVDRMVTYVGANYGPDEAPFEGPLFMDLSTDGKVLWFTDRGKVAAVNVETEEFFGHIQPPEGYKGVWGELRRIKIGKKSGNLLTTWLGFNGVRVFNPSGDLVAEWVMPKPTKDEYEKAGRPEDFERNDRFPVAPTGLTEDGAGNIWVNEAQFRQVHIYSAEGKLIKKIGEPSPREHADEIIGIPGIADYHRATNRVYIADMDRSIVRAFDAATMEYIKNEKGEPTWGWKRRGAKTGYVQQLFTIKIYEDEVWVIDGITGQTFVYNMEMEYLGTITDRKGEKKTEKVVTPGDVVKVGNKILLSDTVNSRIVTYALQ